MGYKSRKIPSQCIVIPKMLFENITIGYDCRILVQQGKYYLAVPISQDSKNCESYDRSFMTVVSNSEIIEYKHNQEILNRNDIIMYGDIKSSSIVNKTFNDLKFFIFKQRLLYKASTNGKKFFKYKNNIPVEIFINQVLQNFMTVVNVLTYSLETLMLLRISR